MSERDEGTVRGVAWSELFPWLSIVRSFRLAIALRVLLLGAVGILLTAIVWAMIGSIFGTDTPATEWLKPFTECPWRRSPTPFRTSRRWRSTISRQRPSGLTIRFPAPGRS